LWIPFAVARDARRWRDDPELGQMRADRVHGLGLLTDEEIPRVAPEAHLRCDVVEKSRLRPCRLHRRRAEGTPAA
jgi:hypothetical protein